jgi:hypothetical protein
VRCAQCVALRVRVELGRRHLLTENVLRFAAVAVLATGVRVGCGRAATVADRRRHRTALPWEGNPSSRRPSMLIARDQTIAGVSAVTAREVARLVMHRSATVGVVADEFGISRDDSRTLLRALAAEGFLTTNEPHEWSRSFDDERQPGGEKPELWRTTVAGNALAKARIGKRMPRERAERYLREFLERVEEVNADPDELWWVEHVELFGSLADPTSDEVGDVDVRVLAECRDDPDTHTARVQAVSNAARRRGHRFPNVVAEVFHAQTLFTRRLRGQSNRIDMQLDVGQPRPLPDGAVTVTVYERARAA